MSAIHSPSFRVRLALMVGTILVVTIGLVLVAVGVAVDRVLVLQTADRLEIGAGLLLDRPRNGPPVTELDATEVAGILGGQGTAVAILAADGTALGTADNGAPAAVTAVRLDGATYAAAIESGATVRSVVGTPAGRVLVVAAPIRLTPSGRVDTGEAPDKGRGPAFVPPGQAKKGATPAPESSASGTATAEALPPNSIAQLAVSLAPVDATIAELRVQLALLGALALAIGLASAVVVTARSTRPLERVVVAAERLADGDLSARTGVSGPGEIGAVGRAFDTMAERLQAAFEAQRGFAADASHELRTPLAVLGGYVDLLRRGGVPPDEERRLLGSMRREVDRLARLASDLLLLAKLDAGAPALEPRPFDLADLVREQAESARMLDPAIDVVADAAGPLPVIADPDRIAQALRNLIENAVRHSAPGSSVQIVTSREGDVAVARVVNAGSPLDPAAVPGLFERFVRGDEDGAGAPPGGPASSHAGLGLAIAKAIVEASGGSITAESDAVTTRFTIRLAISRSMASQALLRP